MSEAQSTSSDHLPVLICDLVLQVSESRSVSFGFRDGCLVKENA